MELPELDVSNRPDRTMMTRAIKGAEVEAKRFLSVLRAANRLWGFDSLQKSHGQARE